MKVSDHIMSVPHILIYGPAGTAKTSLALTLGERAEIIDCDGNLEVAFGLKDNLQSERMKVTLNQYLDTDPKKGVAFGQAKARIMTIAEQCKRGTYKRDVLIIDSLSALDVASKYNVMAGTGNIAATPQLQHWGTILSDLENLIHTVKTLPILTIIIAHETLFTTATTSKVQIAVSGQKLPGRLTRAFSEIWYTKLKQVGQGKTEFSLQTVPTADVVCRSGRGLRTNQVFATADAQGLPEGKSVCMWDILKDLGYEPPVKEGVATAITV